MQSREVLLFLFETPDHLVLHSVGCSVRAVLAVAVRALASYDSITGQQLPAGVAHTHVVLVLRAHFMWVCPHVWTRFAG
eukprot:COSAG02_NODE_2156_length_9643_cov_55.052761_11_plen_79_part_00